MKKALIVFALSFFFVNMGFSQGETDPYDKEVISTTGLWLGSYTKYRLGEKLFYYGEYHFRRRNQFINDMAQIYLRFGLTYLVNKQFEVTGGIVTPFYWAPDQSAENIDPVVNQYRFWEQFLFVQPIGRAKLYHQFRFEQRWKRDYVKGSPFKLTHRFRYKISSYYPLNHYKLMPKTLFLSFYEEIFFQTGKPILYDHFEDNRVFLGLGYIVNENIQLQAGYMWTFRHNGSPFSYEHRHIPRISIYHNLDFYRRRLDRRKQKVIILEDEF